MSKTIDISAFIPELLPIEKSNHLQLNDIKKNIIKMFTSRGFIKKENENKAIKKLTALENDDMEYIVEIDIETNYNTTIPNKKIYIKIFDYKITSINKNSPIGEFISKYDEEYKFIVVQDINQKSEQIIESYNTSTEVFKITNLKQNITDHVLVPKHEVLSKAEGEKVLSAYCARRKDMMLIRSNDAVAKYYNMKPNEIVKIIRPSVTTCEAPAYRLVIKSTDSKAKT